MKWHTRLSGNLEAHLADHELLARAAGLGGAADPRTMRAGADIEMAARAEPSLQDRADSFVERLKAVVAA